MSKTTFRKVLLAFSLLLFACSTTPEETELEQAETTVDEIQLFDPLTRPENAGVFIRHEGGLIELRRGQLSELYPTNAERGFGFSETLGELIVSKSMHFVVNTQRLNAHMLQLTRVDGYAVLPPIWSDEARAENVAWLPSQSIPVSLEVLNKDEGYVELSLEAPLAPGFYVLHDDSFIRSRTRNDVSAYYPFVVTAAKGGELPLVTNLGRCFDEAFLRYENAIMPAPSAEEIQKMRSCATQHQLLMHMDSTKDELKTRIKEQLLFLQHVSKHNDPMLRNLVLEVMDPSNEGLALWFWKQIQADALLKLSDVHKAITDGREINPKTLAALYFYYYGEEKLAESVESLLWLPFYSVENSNPYVAELFTKVKMRQPWTQDLIELLGAMQVEKIRTQALSNKKIINWYELLAEEIPPIFRKKSIGLKLNQLNSLAVIGPMKFTDVSKEQELALRTAIQARSRELVSCARNLERRIGKRSALFVYHLPLDAHLMGHNTASSMRDPIDRLRSTPIVDADFIACSKAVFDVIALTPALEPKQSVTFGITINANYAAPWLK